MTHHTRAYFLKMAEVLSNMKRLISVSFSNEMPIPDRQLCGSGGGTRTHDLRIMIPSLLPAELPRHLSGGVYCLIGLASALFSLLF